MAKDKQSRESACGLIRVTLSGNEHMEKINRPNEPGGPVDGWQRYSHTARNRWSLRPRVHNLCTAATEFFYRLFPIPGVRNRLCDSHYFFQLLD